MDSLFNLRTPHPVLSRNRIGSLSLLEIKQLLLILCNTQHFGQLTVEEFNLAADHNRCVNRFRFESIIKVISKFFLYIDESTFFRSHSTTGMIKECFEQVPLLLPTVFLIIYSKHLTNKKNFSNSFDCYF